MPGTVTIVAAPRSLGRAGRLRVWVDGRSVGKVRQGGSLEVTAEDGEHRIRISSGIASSGTVTLTVSEGSRRYVDAGARRPYLVGVYGAALFYLGSIVHGVILTSALLLGSVAVLAIPRWLLYLRVTPQPDAAPEALVGVGVSGQPGPPSR